MVYLFSIHRNLMTLFSQVSILGVEPADGITRMGVWDLSCPSLWIPKNLTPHFATPLIQRGHPPPALFVKNPSDCRVKVNHGKSQLEGSEDFFHLTMAAPEILRSSETLVAADCCLAQLDELSWRRWLVVSVCLNLVGWLAGWLVM